MHSMLLAPALLQHSRKKLTVNHVLPALFKTKNPPLKFSTCSKIASRVVDSWYYVEKYQRKRVACRCYQKLSRLTFSRKTTANALKLDASK